MENTLERKVYDGNEAKAILESDTWQWMFESTLSELTEHICRPSSNAADLLNTNLAISLLKRLQAQLQTRMETGKLALLELEHKRKLADQIRGVFR